MKYKVGDKVRIKSHDWYKEQDGLIPSWLCPCCGRVMTITVAYIQGYAMEEVRGVLFKDFMIEGLVEEETKPEPKFKVGDRVEVLKSGHTYTISQMMFNGKEFVYTLSNNGKTACLFSEEEIEFTEEDKYWCDIMSESDPTTYVLPQGYQFKDENGNIINTTKIVLEKKEKSYPKSYEECCYVLGFENTELVFEDDYRDINPPKEQWKRLGLMNQLNKLLICRDAYWKLYREEMGLGKPWKPDFDNLSTNLEYMKIGKGCFTYSSRVFVFPTAEMRDAFYENFKELIESVKELL